MKMFRLGDIPYIHIESDEEAEALRSPNGYTITIGPDNEIRSVEANKKKYEPSEAKAWAETILSRFKEETK